MDGKTNPDMAIILCTYSPNELVISRTLDAISRLSIPADTVVECIVVDNNSSPPLIERQFVREFLRKVPWVRLVVETRQGLTNARIRGLKSTTAPVLIYFDDDNEPDKHYLIATKLCLETTPCVFIWGPGKTTVEFLSEVLLTDRPRLARIFQEREFKDIEYGCVPAQWERYYPFGTGMVAKREVLENYARAVEAGTLSATDRNGRQLLGGGDTQMVWEAIKMGKAAGVAPSLQITHIIPAQRLTNRYLSRLLFATGSSYTPVLVESFPSERERVNAMLISNMAIIKALARIIVRNILRLRPKNIILDIASYIGPIVGLISVRRNGGTRHWTMCLSEKLKLY